MIVDHLAFTHIIEHKTELATTRIKRLLKLISSYSFNLYYIKGKDMILSDFLSRQRHDNSNPHETIPISFNMHSILHNKYFNIGNAKKYLVQTWSHAKSSEIKLPEVHGVSKSLHPNIQPEKLVMKPLVSKVNKISQIKARLGQGRSGINTKAPY